MEVVLPPDQIRLTAALERNTVDSVSVEEAAKLGAGRGFCGAGQKCGLFLLAFLDRAEGQEP